MKVVRFDEMEEFNTPEGIMKPLFVSEKIAIIHLKIPSGLKVEPHSHPRDGMMYLIKGRVKLNNLELNANDFAYIPANFEVGLECEDEAEAILISVNPEYKSLDELKSILRRFKND
ncbi:hypothetical protein [Methanocaldococcus fervens]|uniref:Cupin 2 conserved barrel domain protein n=1 Tax=Methanocaldococcus fervens (strain DSM 4213 / JCM 15782 / AG86) TaxID=573064 RepID=C7P6J3_METFA|nr:hypothetical protein [Methanocaldococcus fervens]ACV24175.1 hypothetical protein Mefer_0340 [Methanocaldococcus fervens AG86]